MKKWLVILLCMALFAGCRGQGVRSFWDTHSIDYSDIDAAEEQFATFAEKAVASNEEDALAAIDALFDLLKEDEVAYYIYLDWINGAFYSLLSPCRSAVLYGKAVDRMVRDGILSPEDCEPFVRRREWIQYNRAGEPAKVPGLETFDARTLVLVLDLACPSCREALEKLAAAPEWAMVRKVAVACGPGPEPSIQGWEYLFPGNATAVFDPRMTPVYFVVGENGLVETSYTLAL